MKKKSHVKTVDAATRSTAEPQRGIRRNRLSGLCCAALLAIAAVGCAVDDEPAVAEQAAPVVEAGGPVTPAGLQIVFACITPTGGRIGLPKSTLAACQAACPSGNACVRCVWQNNALECD